MSETNIKTHRVGNYHRNLLISSCCNKEYRRCIDCKKIKPISDFSKREHGKYYLSMCKDCNTKRTQRWVVTHKEHVREYHRARNLRKRNPTGLLKEILSNLIVIEDTVNQITNKRGRE